MNSTGIPFCDALVDRGGRYSRSFGSDDHSLHLEEGPLEDYLALPLEHQALALLRDRHPETFYDYLAQNPICLIYISYRQKDCPKGSGHLVSVSRVVASLFVLLECFLQERDELSLQFGTAKDLGIRAQGGDFAHGPEYRRGPTLDDSTAVFEALDGCHVVGDYGLAVSGECIAGKSDRGRLEGVSMRLWGELTWEQHLVCSVADQFPLDRELKELRQAVQENGGIVARPPERRP